MTSLAVPAPVADERAALSWAPGPLSPRLSAGAVHVWRAELAVLTDDLTGLLSLGERERAERFRHGRDGQLWARARGVLRALLGRYLQTDPRKLEFSIGAHGKPALPGGAPETRTGCRSHPARSAQLFFNASHSQALALYALTEAGAVGVDVEIPRSGIDEVALAARAFGPAAARRLQALDPAARGREFLRAWTRHEAELKCRGTGLGGSRCGGGARTGELWIAEFDVGPAAAAVAVQGPPRELLWWDWEGL